MCDLAKLDRCILERPGVNWWEKEKSCHLYVRDSVADQISQGFPNRPHIGLANRALKAA